MPRRAQGKSLAEVWSVSKDGLVYEFVLRKGVKFHNGDVMTADDVKFSFERYRGASAKLLKDRVAAVEVVDPHKVRFRLKKPWLDFMTFFATPATLPLLGALRGPHGQDQVTGLTRSRRCRVAG